jgi:DnaJ-class molecular chaperone
VRGQSWSSKDYYQVLGVAPGSTEEEIRRAYRRLALQHHPDRNPGDRQAAERFKEISEAYAVLVDPAKRREYDAFREATSRHEPFTGQAWNRDDLFRDLFFDRRSADLFEELSREFRRLGFRFDDRFFRETLFGGRGVFFGGVVVFGPFGMRRMIFRRGREVEEERPREVRTERTPEALPSFTGFLGWLGRELKAVAKAPADGVRRLLALGRGSGRSDLFQTIQLTPDEARRGGKTRVVLKRDGRVEELLVTIPPAVRPGTRLRLRDRGLDGGDLYLTVDVK